MREICETVQRNELPELTALQRLLDEAYARIDELQLRSATTTIDSASAGPGAMDTTGGESDHKHSADEEEFKIVSMVENPTRWALEARAKEHEELKEMVTELRLKIKMMEESGAVVSGDSTKLLLERDTLQRKVDQTELARVRLKEVFHSTVQQFREACYELMGYQIDAHQSQFRLHSMYAERPEDSLLFKKTSGGMQVLETPFLQTLPDEVTSKAVHSLVLSLCVYVYMCVGNFLCMCVSMCGELICVTELLHQGHSIPAFLSGVTQDLYFRNTMRL